MKLARAVLAAATLALPAGAAVRSLHIRVDNPTDLARPDAPVTVSISDIARHAPDFRPEAIAVTRGAGGPQVPCQADDLDGDGRADEIAFEIGLAPHETVDVVLTYGAPADMQALRMPFTKRAHAAFQAKYEGMGWESDRVAWRLYFDDRNAIDLYGKRQPCLALDYFAQPEVNYHAESPIGRDIYKNGDALGIGSVGAWVSGKAVKVSGVKERRWKVLADGPVRAVAELTYIGWPVSGKTVNLTSRLTVWAGQHWFEHRIRATGADGVDLVTALPMKPGVTVMGAGTGRPSYLATWGRQVLKPGATAVDSMPDQNLGLACVFGEGAPALWTDSGQRIARLPQARDGDATVSRWWVCAGWDQEQPDGVSLAGLAPSLTIPAAVATYEDWGRYCSWLADQMAHPLTVTLP